MIQSRSAIEGTEGSADRSGMLPPAIALPTGGGAIRGIGEKFAANPVTGTGSMTVPLFTSSGRSGFGPQLSLSYDSGAGNGPFGFGWSLPLPSVARKTDRGLPQYQDALESDVFLLSGAEDLTPLLVEGNGQWERQPLVRTVEGMAFSIQRYRPRSEGLFARIERWTNLQTGETHWRSIARENVTSLYGRTEGSRISDPGDPMRVFEWLLCESYDTRGNAIVYEYAAENSEGVDLSQTHERNRTTSSRSTHRHLKRVSYGNETPRLPNEDLSQRTDWLFEVVFDYDEGHYEELPSDPEGRQLGRASVEGTRSWSVRQDPFSSHRAGFEVRSYRLCRRVLMFHHFPDELGTDDCLVRSTELAYREGPIASFISAIVQTGYARQDGETYVRRSLPPLEFAYSRAEISEIVHDLDAESLANLPHGVDGSNYQWVDLDGEGVSGILTEQADAWFYKSSQGGGRFGPLERVAARPSLAALSGGRQQLLDLAGDGRLDLVDLSGQTPGFFERTWSQSWNRFTPFRQLPTIPFDDRNVRFVDLNGDGHADVLITEDEVLTWHRSLGEEGFGPAHHVRKPSDDEQGPTLVFADATESIYLADMCGDGLSDLVRIRSAEVCYWPSLGYGRFGPKVTMDDAPWLDGPDQFDQQRIRLADIDGSGVADIIYLGRDGVRLYFNESGNRWSEPRRLSQLPPADDLASVTTADLLGNGTACLVWSSSLPDDARRPMRYMDLMGGQKPHLLIRAVNNLGAETHVQYAPSTKFYLADKRAGTPWITRIPFPVHVVERVETRDRISGNRFVTRYAYHHGYFDGVEREFCGFGLVEQWDTEEFSALAAGEPLPAATNVDESSHVPPVLTRTWYHTGVHLGRDHVSDFFAGLADDGDVGEYYREPGVDDAAARRLLLDDTVLPDGLTVDEEREACRALRGSMLRQEVYALDGTDDAPHPYAVTEQNFAVRRLQPKAGNHHAVFLTHPRESIQYHYERRPADPRVAHALTLEVDAFGNVLRSAAVAYGRRQPDPALEPRDQLTERERLITYAEHGFTNPVDAADDHRTPLPCESRSYELTGLVLPAGRRRFAFGELLDAGTMASPLAYEQAPTPGTLQKRLIEHVRTVYRRDTLAGPLPLGALQSLALPFESYRLAFTQGLVEQVYGGRVTDAMLQTEGRYVHGDGDAGWWIPSGRVFYSPDPTDAPPQELAHAHAHFFLPHRYRDPFHTDTVDTETFVSYDAHDLLVQETRDALGNRVTVGERALDPMQPLVRHGHDYRVLQPTLVMDPNRNRSAAAYDALGMVVGTAVMGKPEDDPQPGDSLDDFVPELSDAAVTAHLQDPLADPHAILRRATTRLVYDLFAYHRTRDQADPQPAVVSTLARETHDADLAPGQQARIQQSFAYSDGFGREIQRKIRAEPGPVPIRDPATGRVVTVDGQPEMTPNEVSPRWVGSGWTVFDNKGEPVRRYEPFFTDTHRFEFDAGIGVSPVLCYDPVGRVIATLHPDHTWEKVVFDAWRQETWDGNDTVLLADPAADPDVGDFFRRLPDADYLPTWHARREGGALGPREQAAAHRAAVHAATPGVTHFDALGRAFLTVAHNRFKRSDTPPDDPPDEVLHRERVLLDIEGNPREVIDASDRVVARYDYDMLGGRVHQASMEAGERWTLNDVGGNPLYAWGSRDHRFRTGYDPLRRPVESYLSDGGAPEQLVGRTIHGETLPDPEAANLRGKVVQLLDQAGVVTSHEYDFRGNLLRSQRQLAREYRTVLDWSASVPLDDAVFTSRTSYDALARPTELTAPDGSVVRPSYNEANLLETMEVNLRGAAAAAPFVTDVDYDARGRHTRIAYGNGVATTYEYDPLTFRLTRLLTRRRAAEFPDDCPQPPPAGWPGCQVQDLRYTFDPVGNITHIRDHAQQTLYFRNRRVEPSNEYTYDALYRLIEATGREHLGQTGGQPDPPTSPDALNGFHSRLDHPGDGNAMGRYVERYLYDAVGNVLSMQHRGSDPAHPGWTRVYAYDETSQLEIGQVSNRLSATTRGATTETYRYDGAAGLHGNITGMPHLPLMRWDHRDQLHATARQVVTDGGTPEMTWYVYDSAGQRVRKVTERQAAAGQTSTRRTERVYLGGFEIYREYASDGDAVELERETLHVMDDRQRIALVESRTQGSDGAPAQVVRYQLGNHLGSASLELDEQARIVSYEEYTPYGSTSYQAVRSQTEAPKRYRYTGKERDEESGFYYHGARYYAAWLGRWTSADPLGLVDGTCTYGYARNNPIRLSDPTGGQAYPSEEAAQAAKNAREVDARLDQLAETYHADPVGFAREHGWGLAGEVEQMLLLRQEERAREAAAPPKQGDTKPPPEAEPHVPVDSPAYTAEDYLAAIQIAVRDPLAGGLAGLSLAVMHGARELGADAEPDPVQYAKNAALVSAAIQGLVAGKNILATVRNRQQAGSGSSGTPASPSARAPRSDLERFDAEFTRSNGQLLNQQAKDIYTAASRATGNFNLTVGVSTAFVGGKQLTVVTVSDPKAWVLLSKPGALPEGFSLGYKPTKLGKDLDPLDHVEIAGPRWLADRGANAAITGTSSQACGKGVSGCSELWKRPDSPTGNIWHTNVR